MFENGKLSLYKKIKLKSIIDILFMVLFSAVVILIMLNNNNSINSAIIVLVVFWILYIIQMQFVKKWLFTSFKESFEKDLEITHESIKEILDASSKQQLLLTDYADIVEDIKNFFYKLKNFSSNAKTSTTKMVENTKQTFGYAEVGYTNIQNSIEKMYILKQQTQTIARLILELSEHIEQISSTTSVVENIAEQTNMLALNTAVEAARAGEHGKGFAVVAGEIRKLADESKQATHKITYLINNIQQVANSTVMATEEGANEIETTVKIVQTLDSNAIHLRTSIKDILSNIENLMSQNEEQTVSSSEIDTFIKDLEKNIILSTEMLEKTIKSITLLNKASESFNKSIIENKE